MKSRINFVKATSNLSTVSDPIDLMPNLPNQNFNDPSCLIPRQTEPKMTRDLQQPKQKCKEHQKQNNPKMNPK
jgi:hypothetical protein